MIMSEKCRNNNKHNNNSDNPLISHHTDEVTTMIIPWPLVVPTEVITLYLNFVSKKCKSSFKCKSSTCLNITLFNYNQISAAAQALISESEEKRKKEKTFSFSWSCWVCWLIDSGGGPGESGGKFLAVVVLFECWDNPMKIRRKSFSMLFRSVWCPLIHCCVIKDSLKPLQHPGLKETS